MHGVELLGLGPDGSDRRSRRCGATVTGQATEAPCAGQGRDNAEERRRPGRGLRPRAVRLEPDRSASRSIAAAGALRTLREARPGLVARRARARLAPCPT